MGPEGVIVFGPFLSLNKTKIGQNSGFLLFAKKKVPLYSQEICLRPYLFTRIICRTLAHVVWRKV